MTSDLLTAAKNGYYSQVVALLSSTSCDLDARDKDKATPLYWSASRGHARICQVLLQAGCDVNACVKWGSTALHAAADRGHAECLTVLLDSGADVQMQNARGDTALHLAAYRGYRDLVQLLVATGRANPFLKNAQSKTPLQEAQSQQHTAAASVLQLYMESLGCHPFKSLPTSEASSKSPSPQEQPTSSAPAQSWPRYQSFPKYPDLAPPGDPSQRPHTHPLLVNNLSQGAGGSNSAVQGSSRARSEIRLNHVTGITGMKGLPGLAAGPGNRLLQPVHVHSDPQEHADECVEWSKVQAAKDTHSEHHRHGHGVGDGRRHQSPHPSNGVRLNQLSRLPGGGYHGADNGLDASSGGPTRQCTQSSAGIAWRHQNGQDGLNGVNKTITYQTDIHPPPMAPPRHHHPQGFLKHEDLTLFAESLQLEVVKLRDMLNGKEHEASELEDLVSSLRTQNTELQQLVSEKRNQAEEMLTAKDSEISDLKRRLHDLEKQNLCLQQAVAEGQASSSQMSAQRDSQVLGLMARVSDLERLNNSLQQLLVTQQDAMKRVLASKDLEMAALKDKVAELTHKMASCPAAPSGRSVPATDRSAAHGQILTPADNLHSMAEAKMGTLAVTDLESWKTSACVQSSSQSTVYALAAQTQAGRLPRAEASRGSTMLDRGVTSSASSVTPFSCSPASVMTSPSSRVGYVTNGLQQCRLRAAVSTLFHDSADSGKLDADGREWIVGREFQLLELQPVNCSPDGQRRGSCSLVFSIRHQGRKYMLKMLTNLINLWCEGHSQGRSLDAHLLHSFGAEFHAPLLLHPPHPNIVRVRHHYQGDTGHFARYLHLLVPPSLDVPVDMAHRTTFLVLDHYPMTLQSFVDTVWKEEEEDVKKKVVGKEKEVVGKHAQEHDKTHQPTQDVRGEKHNLLHHDDDSDKLREEGQQRQRFLLHMTYQLLSAVEYLQRHDVVHRDIKADNVFLDWRLRPVLGDFGLARTLRGSHGAGQGGQALAPFADSSQVMAGNSHAWAPELCRWSRADPATLTQPVTLKEIYSKSDGFAVARMFYHLFHRPNNNSNNTNDDVDADEKNASSSNSSREEIFPTSTVQQPHYPDSAVRLLQAPVCPGLAHLLRSLVLDDPCRRPSVRQALCRVGVLLFKPDVVLTSEEEAEEFCASQLLVLSALPPTALRSTQAEEETLSMAQSVAANQNHCLADFLLNFSGRDFWEAYTEMTSLGF